MKALLQAAWFIARTDVRHMLRQRETLLWTFVMPPVFFFFIGTITGGFAGGDEPDPITLAAPESAGFLVAQVASRLEQQGFAVERRPAASGAADASGARDTSSAALRLTLPAGFTDALLAGRRVTVTLATDAEGMDADYDEMRVGRAVYGVLADVVVAAGEAPPGTPSEGAIQAVARAPRTLTLDVTQAGKRQRIPTGFDQAVPGTMVMFTLLVMLTSGAISLVLERNEGLLRRLAAAPLPRGGIVLGKWLGRMALGLVQIGFAMLAGTLLFHARWGPDLPAVLGVLVAWAALAAALGLLLGNLARSEGQATAVGVLASNVLAALGGCWWPIEVTAPWMQKLALALPTGWAMEALHRLVSFEAGPASVVPHVTALALATVLVGWAATRTFRYE
jgi:ABC-type Na+ efflux pump permease subunit